jgi:hypothetical protein
MALNLTNIAVNYTHNICTSLYNGVTYKINWFAELGTLKTAFEAAYSTTLNEAVVQLDAANPLTGEKIISAQEVERTLHGVTGVGIEIKHVEMTDVATNHAALLASLQAARLVIEADITAQLS